MAVASALAVASLAGTLSLAQQNSPSQAPADATPAPAAPPVLALPPAVAAPPPPVVQTTPAAPAANEDITAEVARPPANVAAPTPEKPAPPIVPPRPVRGALAVLQVLDKVTAETLRFQVPVGGRVRYKSLLIEVKVCETRGVGDPLAKPSAYLDISSDPRAAMGGALSDRKQVFKGWMFANAPGVHALQHPTYDLWLIACGAGTTSPAPVAAN